MGEKSELKRELILTKAGEVFARKGFREVTMKDIVEACGISRGGLYLYFGSTSELFDAILERRLEEEGEDLAVKIRETTTMAELLLLFLKEQKKMILRTKDDISIAAYEYLFAKKDTQEEENKIKSQFKTGIIVLKKILEEGIMNGEFYCEDPLQKAAEIMYVIEGMKICSKTMGLSESKVDRELYYLISGLLIEE